MAISTKAQLKTAAASWANKGGLTALMDDFVTLCEGRLNDMLLLKNMETETELTASVSSATITLPTGFVSPIAMWITVSGVRVPLEPALPQEFDYTTVNGQPRYFAIDGVNVRFDCPAQAAYSAPFRYIRQANLAADGDTNYLLSKRPDIYLAGVLVEIARYLKDVELFNEWEPRFLKSTAELKASDARNRGIVPLRTDIPVFGYRRNIERGE